jgi:ketosteroid isomerase-like protein
VGEILRQVSLENVEVVRQFYEAWNGDDRRDATFPFIADDFEWVNPPYAVEPGTRTGVDGWLQAMENLSTAFHDYEHRTGEFVDLGERVLCYTTFVVKAGMSEIAFERDEPHLWTLRDGKIIRLQWFHDRNEALEAAGLD